MEDCLFCKIANSDPSELVWQNEYVSAFKDIHPKASVHVLIVPRSHVANLDDLTDKTLASELFSSIAEIAKLLGVSGAYRIQVNNGQSAGQVIQHLHVHLLGGAKLPKSLV
ncbi:MAG: HIT domain-containing protein [Candidatus Saccharimonadia bacterium]